MEDFNPESFNWAECRRDIPVIKPTNTPIKLGLL
jgi:hypothetical protein